MIAKNLLTACLQYLKPTFIKMTGSDTVATQYNNCHDFKNNLSSTF